MLLRTVLLPSVLGPVPEDPLGQRFFCSVNIGLLHDLAENGVVLVDEEELTKNALDQAVKRWPAKFRKRGQTLLARLSNRNRFIKIPSGYISSSACNTIPCQRCIEIAKAIKPKAVLSGGECVGCARSQLSSIPTVDVAEYSLSKLFFAFRAARAFVLGDGEWTQDDFAEKILIPIFRDAKHVKIYDRMIGRSIWTKEKDRKTILTRTAIRDHYQLALEWIFRTFLQSSDSRSERTFEIYSGLDVRHLDPQEVSVAVAALREFEADMPKAHGFLGFPLTVTIKKETHQIQMPHGRYLITDQVGILIERGFDLLWTDEQMWKANLDPMRDKRPVRDVMVAYCPEPGKIESHARKLPDICDQRPTDVEREVP